MSDEPVNQLTRGEELYLLHLSRFEKDERSPEDFDLTITPRKRSTSAGEELWVVHCQRSQERNAEDNDESELETDISLNKKKKMKLGTPKQDAGLSPSRETRSSARRLRNRVVESP
jgi:hypothetical protein